MHPSPAALPILQQIRRASYCHPGPGVIRCAPVKEPLETTLAQAPSSPYSLWRRPEFRLFSLGWLALVLAGQIEAIAIGIHVYAVTSNPMSLAWVGLLKALPVIFLALAGGHLADRFDRRLIMIITQGMGLLSILGLCLLAWNDAPVCWFYVFLLTGSIGQALGSPSRSALLPQLVPSAHFSQAMAWYSSLFQVGTMVGPALGGLLMGPHDYTPPAFALAAVLRVASLLTLFFLTVRPSPRAPEGTTFKTVLAGIGFVRHNKVILATITLDLLAVLVGGATYLLPLFAKDILHVSGFGLGLLRSAEALGAIAMAMTIAHLPPFRRAGRSLLWAVVGFGAMTIVFGLSSWFWLSLLAMFFIGAFDNISVIVRHTLVQVLTPDSMRGRVSAVNNVFIVASNDLGGFESGLTARLFGACAEGFGWASPGTSSRIAGAVASVTLGGIGAIGAVLACARKWPEVLRLGSLTEIRPAGADNEKNTPPLQ